MPDSEHTILLEFFRRVWREEKGFVYLALKDPTLPKNDPRFWQRKFFEWPSEEVPVVQTVLTYKASHDVYFAPSLFRERSSLKENVLGAFCFWVEFDGTVQADFTDLPNPNMIVQTSTETHQHIYWCVDKLVDAETLDTVNRALTYQLKADASGWDANQVLRPPETLNHKKRLKASLVYSSEHFVSSIAFSGKIAENLPPKLEITETLPQLNDTIRKYSFTRNVWDLFTKGVLTDRSAGLMTLGYYLAEMNLTNVEILGMLLHADDRWGKFSKRNDQIVRLTEIVTKARQKYPYQTSTADEEIVAIDHETLLTTDVKIEWLWEGILYQSGFLMLTGHSGVGKSQLAMNLADHLIFGGKFLGRPVTAGKRVLLVSLEMEMVELKQFRELQVQYRTKEERVILKNHFFFIPQGYAVPYNRDEEKVKLEMFLQKEKIDVVIFDTLSSMTEQELSKEADAKDIMDWIGRLRTQLGIAVVIIHHHRKAQAGNKSPNELSDVYGSMLFQARPTSILSLWEERKKGLIKVTCLKMRLAPKPKPWYIYRKDDLTFAASDEKVIPTEEDKGIDITDDETTPTVTLNVFEEGGGFEP